MHDITSFRVYHTTNDIPKQDRRKREKIVTDKKCRAEIFSARRGYEDVFAYALDFCIFLSTSRVPMVSTMPTGSTTQMLGRKPEMTKQTKEMAATVMA